jgi:drug/metabolite transporter (DMT)-like permease
MPIYGVILGVLFMNEMISMEMIAGMLLILMGIMVVNYKKTAKTAHEICCIGSIASK